LFHACDASSAATSDFADPALSRLQLGFGFGFGISVTH
jgi:hypothetical protein